MTESSVSLSFECELADDPVTGAEQKKVNILVSLQMSNA